MSQTPSQRDPSSPPATPRWVKIFVAVLVLLVLVVVAAHLAGFNFGSIHHMP